MVTNYPGVILRGMAAVLLVLFGYCGPALAQQVSFAFLPPKSIEVVPPVRTVEPVTLPEAPSHRFWDRENTFLFVTNAALCQADFELTRYSLQNRGRELNPVVRVFTGSTATLAVNFVGESVGVVGISYFFHKTGHHKLERAVSILNIASSAGAVSFDMTHINFSPSAPLKASRYPQ